MSKRRGDYITVEDLINQEGKDSVRFMMLSRSNDVELDFDFKKVTEKSKDNPVFYVQYAFARINSVFRLLKLNLKNEIKIDNKKFILNEYEIQIMKKISEWPRSMEISSNKLEPHRISFYLYELVTLFHAYWNLGKENKELRFASENEEVRKSRLVLLQALAIVIKNGDMYSFKASEENVIDKTGACEFFAAVYVYGLQNMIRCASETDVQVFINTSSDKAVNPVSYTHLTLPTILLV